MRSVTTTQFRSLLAQLPVDVQRSARNSFRTFRDNPRSPGLRLKAVGRNPSWYSVRIDRRHRALAVLDGDTMIWFWIGDHDDYERVIREQ